MQAYWLFESKISDICKCNWRFMEYEDRLSEASFVFITALRTFSTNSGFFWQDYRRTLTIYMQELKVAYQSQACWLSLDRHVRNKDNDTCNCTILDSLIAREPDPTDTHVQRFMNTLSSRKQNILNLLMDGKSYRSVCRRMHQNHLNCSSIFRKLPRIIGIILWTIINRTVLLAASVFRASVPGAMPSAN